MSSTTQSAPITKTSAVTVLANLDRYMAAGGYDADHPWRIEIASACGTESAIKDIHSAACAISDLLTLSLQECRGTDAPGNAEAAIKAADRYVEDIFAASFRLIGSAE